MTRPRLLCLPPRSLHVDRLDRVAAVIRHPGGDAPSLDLDWIDRQRGRVDVVHAHLGGRSAADTPLGAVLEGFRRDGVAVVATVHDVDLAEPGAADALGAVVDLAHQVVTHTRGAADELAERIGTRPLVIPHGPVLSGAALHRARRQRATTPSGRHLLCHVGRLGDQLDWRTAIRAAVRARARLRVLVHESRQARLRQWSVDTEVLDIRPYDALRTPEVVDELVRCRALVLPYRRVTHSSLLELAADVGVPVLAPPVGFLADQHPVATIPLGGDGLDVAALEAMLANPPDHRRLVSSAQDRERVQQAFEVGHARLYESVVTRVGLPRIELRLPDAPAPPRRAAHRVRTLEVR